MPFTYRLTLLYETQQDAIVLACLFLSDTLSFNPDIILQIAELKSINNIHRDNEIFARRTVKVPARLFTKKLPGVHTSLSHIVISEGRSNTRTSSDSSSDCQISDTSVSSHVTIAETSNIKPEYASSVPTVEFDVHGTNRTVLQNNCADNLDVECSTSPLIQQEESSLSTDHRPVYSCNGADWGLSWLQLLICSLLLGFVGPVLYVIYLTEDKDT